MSGGPVPSPITPNLTTYSGTPFNITTGLETVPTNFPVVLLNFTGSYNMAGTPALAAGTYIGQRLLTVPMSGSSGTLTWIIHGGGLEKPILSPIMQTAYGASYAETIDWVWDGVGWGLVSVFNPANGPMDAETVFGNLTNVSSITLGTNTLVWNFGFTTTHDVSGVSRLEYNLVGSELDYGFTSPVFDHGGFFIPDGKLLLVYNAFDGSNPNDDSVVHFYDHNFNGSGSGLFLATPKVTLRKREWILLIRHSALTETGWHEVARSRRDAIFNPTNPSLFSSYDIRGASTVKLRFTAGTSFNLNSVFPSFNDFTFAPFYNGQELLLLNDPQSHPASTVNLDDEGTTPGVLVRLATTTIALTPGDSLRLRYDLPTTTWYEVHRSLLV